MTLTPTQQLALAALADGKHRDRHDYRERQGRDGGTMTDHANRLWELWIVEQRGDGK
jgi:hypothetical protein